MYRMNLLFPQHPIVPVIDRWFDFSWTSEERVGRRDKSNPMFSTRQPLEQWLPSRHPSNKTSSNHDPSPPRKLPCTAQSTKAYINVMRPWPGLAHQSSPHQPASSATPTRVASLGRLFSATYTFRHYIDTPENAAPYGVIPRLSNGHWTIG